MVGTGIYTFFVMSAQAFLSSVQRRNRPRNAGSAYDTSTAPAELVIPVLFRLCWKSGESAGLPSRGSGGFPGVNPRNFFSCVPYWFSLWPSPGLGIVAATLQVAFQKGSALLWLLGSGLWFLSGTMFPDQTLPRRWN